MPNTTCSGHPTKSGRAKILRYANKIFRRVRQTTYKTKSAFSFNFSGVHQLLRQSNRLLERNGIFAYHYHLPYRAFRDSLVILTQLAEIHGIILTHLVIKKMGDIKPAGLLSFACEGYGINFQVRDSANVKLFFNQLTEELIRMKARFYLAKDACLSANQYSRSNDNLTAWQGVVKQWDPNNIIRSDLSNRLKLKPWNKIK